MHLPSTMLPSILDAVRNEKTDLFRSERRSCSPSGGARAKDRAPHSRLECALARAELPHLLGMQVSKDVIVTVLVVVLLAIAGAFGARRRAFLLTEQAIEQAERDHRSGDCCCRRYQDQ